MYLTYFGLDQAPFSITPDPRFVFLSPRHENALAHLRYGIAQGGGGGFVQLTGEVGTGKTTLSRLLLEDLPEDIEVALILNPCLNPTELLEAVCEELRLDISEAEGSLKKLTALLNEHLLKSHAEGRTVVAVIDEAQQLSPAALEQIRLLTNLETATQKLLQIVLLGQPELRDLLSRSDLRQLAQRITARYHLTPLDKNETAEYVRHRLTVAGAPRCPFNAGALRTIYKLSDGVPRLINIIAERCLLAAYAKDKRQISASLVRQSAKEIFNTEQPKPGRHKHWLWLGSLVVAGAAAVTGWQYFKPEPEAPVEPSPVAIAIPEPQPEQPPVESPWPVNSLTQSWQHLLDARIGQVFNGPASACRWEMQPGMHCVSERATVNRIRRLGRPVIVQLDSGTMVVEPFEQAFKAGPGGELIISSEELESRWSGRYWDAWEMPSYVPELLQEGDRGPGVLWVKQVAANAIPAYNASQTDPYFAPSLRQWVMAFQRRSGLAPDGIIGRSTLQHLSRFDQQRDADNQPGGLNVSDS